MPTYSYVCDACGHKFEQFQAMTDEPVKCCPSCGRKRVRRLIGAGAGLIFKGSGFYITDYARKSSPQSAVSGENGKGKGEKSGDIKEVSTGKGEPSTDSRNSDG